TNTLTGSLHDAIPMFTGTNSGTLTGSGSQTFANIQSLVGGTAADSFVLSASGNVTALDGGSGTNTLTGANVASTWSITGTNSGTLTGSGSQTFANIQSLVGGTAGDSFSHSAAGNVTALDGGS